MAGLDALTRRALQQTEQPPQPQQVGGAASSLDALTQSVLHAPAPRPAVFGSSALDDLTNQALGSAKPPGMTYDAQIPQQNILQKAINGIGQPLEFIGNLYESGLTIPHAIQRGQLPQLWNDYLKKGDFAGATAQYGAGSAGQLKWDTLHGSPEAQAFAHKRLDNPWLNAGVSLGEEALNPLNYLGGVEVKGASAIIKALGAGARAAEALPVLGKAIAATNEAVSKFGDDAARMFNKYHGIAQSDPAQGESLFRIGEINMQQAVIQAKKDTAAIFDGTTEPEYMEIVRRSQGLPAKQVAASKGVNLDQRANLLRNTLLKLDQQQKAAGILDIDREFNPDKFFPMSRPETYQQIRSSRSQSVQDFLKERRGPGSYGGAPAVRLGTAGLSGKHKIYEDLDQAIASGKLGEDFNPIVNLFGHLSQRYQNLAVEEMLGKIDTQTDLLQPLEFAHKGVPLGAGEVGYNAADKEAAKIAGQRATAQAMQQTGLAPGRMVGLPAMSAKLREAAAAGKVLGSLNKTGIRGASTVFRRAADTDLSNAVVRKIADPAYKVAKAIDGSDSAWADRITDIGQKYADAKLSNADLLRFRRAKQDALRDISVADIRNTMRMTPADPNHVDASFEALLRTGSKFTKFSSIDVELAHLLEFKGAQPDAASGIARFVGRLNTYRRIGLVSNPVFHLLWNLPMNYLAGGGNPLYLRYLGEGIGNQGSAEYLHWGHLATQYGAHSALPSMGANIKRIADRTMNTSELNPAQMALRQTDRFADWNNYVTFELGEKRMATALFRSFVDKKMSFEQAGIQVRKTMGDFGNVSPDGLEKVASVVWNFYPWTKTIIPLYAKAAVMNPFYVEGITNTVAGFNQQNGQGPDYSRPTTMKNADGSTIPVPLPQKVLGDLTSGPQGWMKFAMAHFGVGFDELAKGAETQMADAKVPSAQNFNTLYDKDAPLADKFVQAMGVSLSDLIPPTATQGFDAMKAVLQKKPDGLEKITGAVTGLQLFAHGPNYQTYQKMLRERNIAIGQALRMNPPDKDTATKLYYMYQPILKQLEAE